MQSWAIQICSISLVMLIVEVFLPAGSTTKYIKLIFSMLVVIFMLQPIFLLLQDEAKWKERIFLPKIQNEISTNHKKANEILEKQVGAILSEKLEKDIKKNVEAIIPNFTSTVDLQIEKNEEKIEIDAVNINLHEIKITKTKQNKEDLKQRILEVLLHQYGLQQQKVSIVFEGSS